MISCTARTSSPVMGQRGTAPMSAPSSSVSARNSATPTPISTTSITTPVLDTAGPDQTRSRRSLRWAWSLTIKTGLLAVIFLLVPVFLYVEFRNAYELYVEFRNAYEESQELLLRSVRD